MRILVTGSFSKTGEVFYAKPVQPVFLGWSSSFSRMRALLRFAFMRMLYGWGNAGGLLLALLAADKAFLPQNCTEAFRNAGLAHILALSGMHLSLIGTAALQGGRLFGHKKRALYFSLAAVCAFVWFAGSAPSLNRALGMVFIAAIGEALLKNPSVFFLDEPSASFSPQEITRLYGILRSCANRGACIIVVTHRIQEVQAAPSGLIPNKVRHR